jgi:hypothetical protein
VVGEVKRRFEGEMGEREGTEVETDGASSATIRVEGLTHYQPNVIVKLFRFKICVLL